MRKRKQLCEKGAERVALTALANRIPAVAASADGQCFGGNLGRSAGGVCAILLAGYGQMQRQQGSQRVHRRLHLWSLAPRSPVAFSTRAQLRRGRRWCSCRESSPLDAEGQRSLRCFLGPQTQQRIGPMRVHAYQESRVSCGVSGLIYPCSIACATRKIVASSKCLPSTCAPIGSPALELPQGTEIPQMPARFAVTV